MIRIVIFSTVIFFTSMTWAKSDFLKLFPKEKPIIAAIMIEKDLSSDKKVTKAITWGLEQSKIAVANGMDGILFEFRGGKILQPKISTKKYEAMKKVATALVNGSKGLVVGVEILWHYPNETLRLAKDSGAKFVRVDFFTDKVIADEKEVPIDPQALLAYKKKIGADKVVLLTDIQVKYSKMVDPSISIDKSAAKALKNGSQGVIVTSTRSGLPPSAARAKLAKKGAKDHPVIVGSGFSYNHAPKLLPYVDAVIVGTKISVKTGGPLVPKKVNRLMTLVNEIRTKNKDTK